jgi:hypothetical protein
MIITNKNNFVLQRWKLQVIKVEKCEIIGGLQ